MLRLEAFNRTTFEQTQSEFLKLKKKKKENMNDWTTFLDRLATQVGR